MPKFASAIDLQKNELQNARTHNLSAAPSSPVEGQVYHNTTDHHDYSWNGSSWQQLDGVPTHNHDANYQAKDAALSSLAAAGNGILVQTSDGTITPRSIAVGTGVAVTNGDGIGGNPTVGLASGVVTPGTATKVTFDTYGRVTNAGGLAAADIPTLDHTKIADFDAQVRTSRLDQMAAPGAALPMNGKNITNVADPVNPQDAATKNYVDNAVQGLSAKTSVYAATTGNINLAAAPANIDGMSPNGAGERYLVKNQTTRQENGIYVLNGSVMTRAADANTCAELAGAYVFVENGGQAGTGWIATTDPEGTIGGSYIDFVQFNGASQITAGAGLTKSGNTLDIGAGTGITVNADSIAVTNPKLKFSADSIAANPWTITHNFGTIDVIVAVYEGNNEVMCDVARTSVNVVTLSFATTPTAGQYRAVIIG